MARGAPRIDSKVRSISSSFDWTSTCTQTSSGMRFSSMRRRVKSNSICEAEGKPISISLKPIFTSRAKYSSFSSTLMGTASAWLPSRRSTLHQVGARSIVREGHARSVIFTAAKGRYFGFWVVICFSSSVILSLSHTRVAGSFPLVAAAVPSGGAFLREILDDWF